MAGKTYIKTGDYTWSRVKKVYLKTGGITWQAVRKAYIKTGTSTWKKIYDTASNKPFIANDIPKIRLNTFRNGSTAGSLISGTANDPVDPVVEAPPVQQMGPSWTSPTYGWPYESLGGHLWGYDGNWTSGNGSTITFIYQWLYNLTGNSNDNVFDPQFYVSNTSSSINTSSTGRADMLTNSASYLGYNGGDYFDKNFLTFRVGASNSAGGPVFSESAPVYIVREVPTGSITMSTAGTAIINSTMSASFTYSNNWYNKTNVSNSYIEWFAVDNLGDSLTNANRVQIEYLSSFVVTGTTSKSGTSFHVPTIANKYYYVKMTLNNSGTENAVIAINGFTPKSSVTSQANKTVKTNVQSYNVAWNGNGGSSGNEGIPWSFTAGGSVTVPSATRIGYTFLRWTDTESGNYTYTTTGGTFSPPSQNITMYARWQINVCTIPNVIGMTEYNASTAVNDAGFLYEYTDYLDTTNSSLVGTVAAIDPPVGSQPGCGTNITLTIYRLAAVVKLSTPTGVSATDNLSTGIRVAWTNVSNAASYGVWWGRQPVYDDGPDFGGPNNNGGKTITGTPFLDDVVSTGTTRDYYVQAFPASSSTSFLKSDWSLGDSGTRVAPTVTQYTISWDANGGTVSPTSNTVNSGTSVSAPTPTRSGYTFLYWRDSPSVFSYVYQINPGGSWTVNSNITFYAYWQAAAVAVPGQPTSPGLTGSGVVSWGAPTSGGPVDSYEIQFYTASNGSGSNQAGPYFVTGLGSSPHQLTSPYGGTNANWARVQIRARNSSGPGLYGAWVPSSTTYT